MSDSELFLVLLTIFFLIERILRRTLTLAAALVFAAPAFAQPSPENTRVPPAPYIRDSGGHIWKLGAPGSPPVTPNTIDTKVLIYCNHRVYAQGRLDGLWYRGTPGAGWIFQEGRASWTLIGAIIPCT